MSATNHTANYELSQYIGSDEPKYLTDYNGDMSKIDTAIKGVDTKAETANTGVATNASAISALDTAVGSLQTQVATVAGVANGNTGSINTINSLIGTGEPTTADKTIIGAINELAGEIGSGTASDISFNKTGTDLNATNVQDAIEEVNAKIPQGGSVDADDVTYDNTSSGLTATNVQAAIDEVALANADLNFVTSGSFTVTSTGTVSTETEVHYLLNANKSIGKIYGGIRISSVACVSGWNKIATLAGTDIPTVAAAYDIIIGYSNINGGDVTLTRLHFNTNGTIDVEIKRGSSSTVSDVFVSLTPCIYILKDLGD